MTDEADNQRHQMKMQRRKEVQDQEVAEKTIEKGLLAINTGPGKGKSTAAFGLALRMLGRGKRVIVVQFIKGAWSTGEKIALERFDDLLEWHTLGEGFTWETQDKGRDIAAAVRAWEVSRIALRREDVGLVVLDELNIALRYDYLPLEMVLEDLAARPTMQHVVITGRNAPAALVEAADLVTEMTLVKHHFKAGVKAQEGIEF
ncbi:cob(I)alamin adenosyltransferase [Acetobacter aceti NBRC 14818]|uniref:Corrinoid adenosyltransferase n=2 Tax=Acetobacter aceti TaxID=435 RepID=A0A6S6PQ27_ACEAC|nr:cob(I)yrinic acid a,c-diamide adenosyltransferase [Acetobacter aceti]TCS27377.1 cob(I)alamin adenosyltransferase [Acetobacter aceti NBRC 14818]BCI68886.1 cob(I)alamin adenosyltransferase [Acetobacter aceti]BCK76722.1 cob(I)alamin adenosyltransferase [Acetobacter aceti NBRC 14818]GAN58661.1 Cob(I) alamin adenosyltransferase [Acetobacter aceti NBRC 14818]